MKKRIFSVVMVLVMVLSMAISLSACGQEDAKGNIILATTTSTKDSGLLDAILPVFEEETGYTAANYKFIGLYYPSPAILSEKIYMYVATGLSAGERNLDEDEFLDVVKLPFDKVVDMILEGEIPDGKTQTAVLKAKALMDRDQL